MLEPIQEISKKGGFFKTSQESILDTNPPLFCTICGAIKKEFTTPDGFRFWDKDKQRVIPKPSRIVVLDCECERELKMFKENYESYRNCQIRRGEKIFVKYSEIIDCLVQPKNDEENEIFKNGQKLRSIIREVEAKANVG